METQVIERETVELRDGKHLVFILGENSYGIPILDISEIIGLMDITPIPKTPDYIKGVINLRGKVIPVMNLRIKFGMPEKQYDAETCIIIINLSKNEKSKQIGVIVDTVSEVFDIPLSEIEAPPNYGGSEGNDFLNSVGKVKGNIVMLLDMKKILNSNEIHKLIDSTKKENEKWNG